jgi:hypothetical protein
VSTLSTLIQNSLGIPSWSNKTGRRNKRNTNGKGRSYKLPLFEDDMILYLKDWKNSTKKLPDIINSSNKIARYKISLQKSVTFLYTNNKQTEREYRKTIPFAIA